VAAFASLFEQREFADNVMSKGNAVIIGAGIMGLAHALTALEAGWSVVVLERDGRPLGASVRNFGTLWPIGCTFGPEREQALFGVQRWKELAPEAGFYIKPQGSLSLAYRPEAWAVLKEFMANAGAKTDGFELLEPDEVLKRFPAVNPVGLRGALRSLAETVVQPASSIAALAAFLQKRGASVLFGTPAVKIHADAVETSDGRRFAFDQLVIAAGDEMRLFFPDECAAAQLNRCRLQMMRTVPQPAGFDLGAILVSDLTLCHYPAFRNCPSSQLLQARLDEELPTHRKWGVHVIAAQHFDGTLTLGDSHEYAPDFDPDTRTEVDDLVLEALRGFVRVPDLRIAARWQGIYLKSKIGQTQVVLHPRERVTMVTAMGGIGMTLSWGCARRTLESWTTST
jgi:FAD dependent oxidoreductase TIGR03364